MSVESQPPFFSGKLLPILRSSAAISGPRRLSAEVNDLVHRDTEKAPDGLMNPTESEIVSRMVSLLVSTGRYNQVDYSKPEAWWTIPWSERDKWTNERIRMHRWHAMQISFTDLHNGEFP